ncbi:hypothetical protein [Phyllobacterium zundukense]|uniref:hypothetical protein n=1 Tax=Phyllobacterium zundukense TaxID=1867719 RepID=UPI0012FFFF1D|nr:hypothetical protein [Phyllobacterium zundukense]
MPAPTVPQDVYQRHEREWQLLREAIAKNQKAGDEQHKFPVPQEEPQWNFQHTRQ